MGERDELENLRDEIREVTIEIIRLCGERLSLARKIGEIKAQRGFPIEDFEVEEGLRREIQEKCRFFGVNAQFGMRLLDLLLDESRRVQRNLVEKGKTDK